MLVDPISLTIDSDVVSFFGNLGEHKIFLGFLGNISVGMSIPFILLRTEDD